MLWQYIGVGSPQLCTEAEAKAIKEHSVLQMKPVLKIES